MLSPDTTQRLADRRMFAIERLTGHTAGSRDGGDPAPKGWHRVALPGCGQVGTHDLRHCRLGNEAVPLAPGLVVCEIGCLGFER
jgi:hypothetical protein